MPLRRPFATTLLPLTGVIVFSLAMWILYRQLHAEHLRTIVSGWRHLSSVATIAALGLTLLNYLIMSGYDWTALRAIGKPLPFSRVGLAAFIGYAFSNNIGLSMVAGASVRYRLYSGWGLSVLDITRVIGLATYSIWIGFFALAGSVFLMAPQALPGILHLPFGSTRPIGAVLLAVVLALFAAGIARKRPFEIRNWRFTLPGPGLFFRQCALSGLDWILAASVLYVLLPASVRLPFSGFVGLFLLAQLAGLVSQVPGGLGVFETVMLVLLTPDVPANATIASLLVYRAVYYLMPLAIAITLLGLHEALESHEKLGRLARFYNRSLSSVMPLLLALATFVGGAVLMFSGAVPALQPRMAVIEKWIPLPLVEMSHFMGSLAGMGLLLLARGLQRRMDAAYMLTVILLMLGIGASILKGLDYEEAAVLTGILLAMLPGRRRFYRKTSLTHLDFSLDWIAAIAIVFFGSVWLGLFSHKYVAYTDQLWWQFAFSASAPRFLRAEVGAIGLALFYAGFRLLRPAPPEYRLLSAAEPEVIAPIVKQSRQTYANLALLSDKRFLVNKRQSAFIMYAIEGQSWITMGDPVGPEAERTELAWEFRTLADRYGGWPVFYEVDPPCLPIYLDMGLTLLKLGEEARVPLATFSLEGSARKGLRHTQNQLTRQGCRLQIVPPGEVASLLPELKAISDEWLEVKHTREKGFSLGRFDPAYIVSFFMALVRHGDRPVAFANLWIGAEKEELSIDLMRYGHDAPNGVMDFLFVELMLWGRQQGYNWFNLGMAPFTGLENHALAPFWNRVGTMVARYGENFYNFQGLRRYKEKFDPVWTPKYLASPGGLVLPRILVNLAALTSGGITGVMKK